MERFLCDGSCMKWSCWNAGGLFCSPQPLSEINSLLLQISHPNPFPLLFSPLWQWGFGRDVGAKTPSQLCGLKNILYCICFTCTYRHRVRIKEGIFSILLGTYSIRWCHYVFLCNLLLQIGQRIAYFEWADTNECKVDTGEGASVNIFIYIGSG